MSRTPTIVNTSLFAALLYMIGALALLPPICRKFIPIHEAVLGRTLDVPFCLTVTFKVIIIAGGVVCVVKEFLTESPAIRVGINLTYLLLLFGITVQVMMDIF